MQPGTKSRGKHFRSFTTGSASAALLLVVQLLLASERATAAAGTGFIRAVNGRFVDEDCNDFVAAGLNTYERLSFSFQPHQLNDTQAMAPLGVLRQGDRLAWRELLLSCPAAGNF